MAYRASVVLVLAMIFGQASAQNIFSREGKTRAHADSLMERFTTASFDGNLDFIEQYFPTKSMSVSIGEFKINWNRLSVVKGRALEFEHVKKDYIGRSFLRHYYLMKFKSHAVYVQLTYYRVQELWHLKDLVYGENIEFLYQTKK